MRDTLAEKLEQASIREEEGSRSEDQTERQEAREAKTEARGREALHQLHEAWPL